MAFVSIAPRLAPRPPDSVRRESAACLDCGVLARGFARVHCTRCGDDLLVSISSAKDVDSVRRAPAVRRGRAALRAVLREETAGPAADRLT
jgi:hypothetical protein